MSRWGCFESWRVPVVLLLLVRLWLLLLQLPMFDVFRWRRRTPARFASSLKPQTPGGAELQPKRKCSQVLRIAIPKRLHANALIGAEWWRAAGQEKNGRRQLSCSHAKSRMGTASPFAWPSAARCAVAARCWCMHGCASGHLLKRPLRPRAQAAIPRPCQNRFPVLIWVNLRRGVEPGLC